MPSVTGAALAALVFLALAPDATAQATRDARLLVTVVDVTGAILPGATVTVVPEDASAGPPATASASDAGVATLTGLKPGRYTITAEFSGFDAGEVTDVRLRAGDNKQQIELALTGFEDTVEVGRDRAVGRRRSQRRIAVDAADRRRDRRAAGRSRTS